MKIVTPVQGVGIQSMGTIRYPGIVLLSVFNIADAVMVRKWSDV